jgi:DNA-binding NarL/FixJ family response regulator
VVLADDHADLLAALELLLTPACDVVGRLTSGDDLLETVVRVKPDVIVLDLFFPPSDGLEMCRNIKQIAPEVQIVLMSAAADRGIEVAALQAGSSAFVYKVLAATDLLPAIQRALTGNVSPA